VRHAAVGVTDTANLFGALEFSEKAAAAGIQPIIGCKLPVRFEPEAEFDAWRAGQDRQSRHTAPLFLLCATDDGYRSLIKLSVGITWAPRAARSRSRWKTSLTRPPD
jgi:DNA polymerase-3 subunit alpha